MKMASPAVRLCCLAISVSLLVVCDTRDPTAFDADLFAGRASPAQALAVDQRNDFTDGFSIACEAGGAVGQGFTPSASTVAAVDLYFLAGVDFPSAGVLTTIAIREPGSGGRVLATSEMRIESAGPVVATFPFARPVPVGKGKPYVLEWRAPAGGSAVLAWAGSESDAYPGGSLIGCAGAVVPGADLAFTTYRLGQGSADDAITVSVFPAAVTIEAGETVQLHATVSGGRKQTDRTVEWRSSNSAVATVDGAGVVTAVAEGVVEITATAAADEAAQGVATVTVEDDASTEPITLSITGITGADNLPVDVSNVFGLIHVTVRVDGVPPALVDRIETLIDGTVMCSNAFVTGAADVSLSQSAPSAFEVLCAVPTAAFNAVTGTATWKNGPHTLVALAVRPSGEVVSTQGVDLTFTNENFLNVDWSADRTAASAPSPRSLAPAGSVWSSGALVFHVLPVNYGAVEDDIASATITLTTSGRGVTGLSGCTPTNDALTNPTIAAVDNGLGAADVPGCPAVAAVQTGAAASPFDIVFSDNAPMDAASPGLQGVEDVLEIIVTSITEGGQPGPTCINPDPNLNPQNRGCGTRFAELRVDNLAPRIAQLSIERTPNQYFGPNSFDLDHGAGGVAPDCEAPCARTVDYGVGGQAEAGVSVFLAGPPILPDPVTDGGPELAETATSNDYVFGLTAVDRTGNRRTAIATPTTTTVVASTTNAAARRFGWDATAPQIEILSGPSDMAVNPDETDGTVNPIFVAFLDTAVPPAGPAGFMPNAVRTRLERILPSGLTCHNAETFAAISCIANVGFAASAGFLPTPGAVPLDGYFRYSIFVDDAAGNRSATTTFWILEDVTAPTFTGEIAAPAVIEGGQPASFRAAVADGVDLGSFVPHVGYAGAAVFGDPRVPLGTLGLGPLLANTNLNATIPAFIRSIQGTSADVPNGPVFMATTFELDVRDVAGDVLRFEWLPPQGPPGNEGWCPPVGAPDSSTQNCVNRVRDIAANVLAGTGGSPVEPQFAALNAANNVNALHGLFTMQPPTATDVCNSVPAEVSAGCAFAGQPTETTLAATVTGPADSFENPFVDVRFYYLDAATGKWELIGSADESFSDDEVTGTRTYLFTATWNAAAPKVRPAATGGVATTVIALGVNETGDGLGSRTVAVIVHGN